MEKRERINKDMHLIINRLKNELDNIVAIILVGGYGRDEGTWIYNDVLQGYEPYNDYDLVVVADYAITQVGLKEICKELASVIKIGWVDITIKSKSELKFLKPTIYHYDLKYASKVVFGDPQIIDLIPAMNQNEITLWDIEALFYTRLWTFMGCMDIHGFKKNNRSLEESRFFKNQMAKALLAVVDALLIKEHSYEPKYKDKVKRAEMLYPDKKWIRTLGNWALSEKLNSSNNVLNSNEMKELYDKVHIVYKEEMVDALFKYYFVASKFPYSLPLNLVVKPYYLIRRLGNLFIRRTTRYEKYIAIILVQVFIFYSYRNDSIDVKSFRRAIYYLKRLVPNIRGELTWDEARVRISELRNEVI